MTCPGLQSLASELLFAIYRHLDPPSLACLGCTSMELRQSVDSAPTWEHFCRNRWSKLNLGLDRRLEQGVSWKRLYCSNNGWDSGLLQHAVTLPSQYSANLLAGEPLTYCFDVTTAGQLGIEDVGPGQEVLLIASTKDEKVLGYLVGDGGVYTPVQLTDSIGAKEDVYSLRAIGGGLVAVGYWGSCRVFPACSDVVSTACNKPVWSEGYQREARTVIDIQYDSTNKYLYGLAHTYKKWSRQYNNLIFASAALQEGGPQDNFEARDFMSGYQFVGFTVVPGSSEIIAGSVHEDCCNKCYHESIPSLCFHKSRAKLAAISVLDHRAEFNTVQRYSTHHRSLHPVMKLVREHYLLTSHAGSPLCVWDRRRMSTVLWEEQPLGHFPQHKDNTYKSMPFSIPERPASHQGLHLDTDGDTLIGQADNGMLWAWDLSKTLGWQKDGPCAGSWTRAAELDNPLEGFTDWPKPLGIWGVDLQPCTDPNYLLWEADKINFTMVRNGGRNVLYGGIGTPQANRAGHWHSYFHCASMWP